MKKTSRKLGLQHRRTKQERSRQNDSNALCRKAGISNKVVAKTASELQFLCFAVLPFLLLWLRIRFCESQGPL